jgi:hypothetical protein
MLVEPKMQMATYVPQESTLCDKIRTMHGAKKRKITSDFTDTTFPQALRKAYFSSESWKENTFQVETD